MTLDSKQLLEISGKLIGVLEKYDLDNKNAVFVEICLIIINKE